MMALSAEYSAVKGDSGGIEQRLGARGTGFNLFSLLEGVATQAGLKDNLKYIKPSSSQLEGKYTISSVEMQFEQITMTQLFTYLHRVEDPANVLWIDRLSIRKQKQQSGYIDATLQVSTLQLT
jgi:general secretion pathway protein M